MNIKYLNESFKRLYEAAIDEEPKTMPLEDELRKELTMARVRLQYQGATNIKQYEIAFQEVIENIFPDKSWWEVTDCNIFFTLFETRSPELTIEQIIAELKPEYKKVEEFLDSDVSLNLSPSLSFGEAVSTKNEESKRDEYWNYIAKLADSYDGEAGEDMIGDEVAKAVGLPNGDYLGDYNDNAGHKKLSDQELFNLYSKLKSKYGIEENLEEFLDADIDLNVGAPTATVGFLGETVEGNTSESLNESKSINVLKWEMDDDNNTPAVCYSIKYGYYFTIWYYDEEGYDVTVDGPYGEMQDYDEAGFKSLDDAKNYCEKLISKFTSNDLNESNTPAHQIPGYYGDKIFELLDQLSADQIDYFLAEYDWFETLGIDSSMYTDEKYSCISDYLDRQSGYQLWRDLDKYCYNNGICESLKSKLKECLNKLNEASISDEDKKDSDLIRSMMIKLGRRSNARFTPEEEAVLDKYGIKRNNYHKSLDVDDISLDSPVDSENRDTYYIKYNNGNKGMINYADRARKIPQRKDSQAWGPRNRYINSNDWVNRHTGYKRTPGERKGESPLVHAERSHQNSVMREPIAQMSRAVQDRKFYQGLINNSQSEYNKAIETARKNYDDAVRRATDTLTYRNTSNVHSRDRAQGEIDTLLKRKPKQD